MKHNRFASNSFFFEAIERIEIREIFVNLKSIESRIFYTYYFGLVCLFCAIHSCARKHWSQEKILDDSQAKKLRCRWLFFLRFLCFLIPATRRNEIEEY